LSKAIRGYTLEQVKVKLAQEQADKTMSDMAKIENRYQ
jgi:hypothetical protein